MEVVAFIAGAILFAIFSFSLSYLSFGLASEFVYRWLGVRTPSSELIKWRIYSGLCSWLAGMYVLVGKELLS